MNMEVPQGDRKNVEQIRAEFSALDSDELSKIANGTESVGELPTAGSLEITPEERQSIAKEILMNKQD